MKPRKLLALLLLCIVTISLVACSQSISAPTKSEHPLPKIGSLSKLKRLVKTDHFMLFGSKNRMEGVAEEAQDSGGQKDHSTTNVQVAGIDESDIVKTDGNYLYQVSGQQIVVTKLYPVEEAKIVNKITFDQEGYYPSEIYIDGNILVVIGHGHGEMGTKEAISFGRGYYFSNNTIVHVYNISDINRPRLERKVEIEGHLITSRKKEDFLYLITNKYVGYDQITENPAPKYIDSSIMDQKMQKKLHEIHYFPQGELSGFISIAAIDIKNHKKPVSLEIFLGNGNNIYMSHSNLYIALTTNNETIVHKFSIDNEIIKYKSKGRVKGWVLNQFSMDEYKGYFRIATTSHTNEMTNNLYILDENMRIVGKLENLAPTERIYAARFMGEKAYLVTFEIVDPLFVIDVSEPTAPKVLGELKIPGFSNYLHPIDKNHLLGIGRDTMVTTLHGREVAIELGIRLTIFDVSDVNNPKEKFVETIGGRGSYSEALYNHKAIYYHNNRLALPLWLTKDSQNDDWYYDIEFIGAYIYKIDPSIGFIMEKSISHLIEDDIKDYYSIDNYKKHIHRIVSIGNYLYTISEGMIQIHDQNFDTINTIIIN